MIIFNTFVKDYNYQKKKKERYDKIIVQIF